MIQGIIEKTDLPQKGPRDIVNVTTLIINDSLFIAILMAIFIFFAPRKRSMLKGIRQKYQETMHQINLNSPSQKLLSSEDLAIKIAGGTSTPLEELIQPVKLVLRAKRKFHLSTAFIKIFSLSFIIAFALFGAHILFSLYLSSPFSFFLPHLWNVGVTLFVAILLMASFIFHFRV